MPAPAIPRGETADSWLTRLCQERLTLGRADGRWEGQAYTRRLDEELAMLPYYGVFQYEKDPALLKAYRAGVNGWWKNIQRELNPLWTFIYLTGQPDAKVDLPGAVWTLYRMPMDTIDWTVRNSHRNDIVWTSAPDRHGRREALTLLPPDERPVMKWNGNPFEINGGNGGRNEDDGSFFLLPYWLGRYWAAW